MQKWCVSVPCHGLKRNRSKLPLSLFSFPPAGRWLIGTRVDTWAQQKEPHWEWQNQMPWQPELWTFDHTLKLFFYLTQCMFSFFYPNNTKFFTTCTGQLIILVLPLLIDLSVHVSFIWYSSLYLLKNLATQSSVSHLFLYIILGFKL